VVTAIIGCLIGIGVGQLDFHSIIVIAYPVLLFIYPITIVLILLNVLPEKYASNNVFRTVVAITFLFSIPDVLSFAVPNINLEGITKYIPFAKQSLGWVLPAFVTFVVVNFVRRK
jgi:LIVCS family branched-chain amino acid:cation transporter